MVVDAGDPHHPGDLRVLRRWQERWVFSRLAIDARPDRRGFFSYLLGYQALTSAASLRGYAQSLIGVALSPVMRALSPGQKVTPLPESRVIVRNPR